MSDPSQTQVPEDDAPVRSTQAVLLLLAALVAIPLIALLAVLLVRGAGGGAGADVTASVDTDRVQAVYLVDGQVFFGNVEEADGDWFHLRDAFYLRRAAAAEGEDEEAAAGLDLVPVSQDVDGDGSLVVNAAEVTRIQNLSEDAEIAQQIEDADE